MSAPRDITSDHIISREQLKARRFHDQKIILSTVHAGEAVNRETLLWNIEANPEWQYFAISMQTVGDMQICTVTPFDEFNHLQAGPYAHA